MTVALVIQGIGDATTGRPYAFAYGGNPSAPEWDDYVLLPDGLEKPPEGLGARVSPLDGGLGVDAMSWTVLARPAWANILMRRVKEARGQLFFGLHSLSSSIDLSPSKRFKMGDVVYIGREAILLGTKTADDPRYDTFSCTRGYLGTTPQSHEVGRGLDDRVYLTYPKVRLRPCYLVEDGVVRYYGVIEDIETANNMTCLHVITRDVIGLFAGRTFNSTPYRAVQSTAQGAWRPRYKRGPKTWEFSFDPTSRPGDTHGHRNTYKTLQILNTSAISWFYNGSSIPHPLQPPVPDIPVDEDGFQVFPETDGFNELLCFGRRFVTPDGTYVGALNTNSGAWTVDGPVLHHVLTAFLHWLLSTGSGTNHEVYDFWGREWGLGLPVEMVDVEGIEALRAETPGLDVENAVLGWDGKTWSSRDFILKTLIPLGLFPHTDGQGRVTVSRLQVVLDDFIPVPFEQIEPMSEAQKQNLLESHEAVEGSVGVPWREPTTIVASDKSRATELYDPRRGAARRLDLSLYALPDYEGEGGAAEILEQYLQWVRVEIPTDRFVWVGPAEPPHPGMLVGLEPPSGGWPPGFDGILFTDDGARQKSLPIKGIVTHVKRMWGRGNVWEIALWRINSALIQEPKAIPPAFEISDIVPFGSDYAVITIPRTHRGIDVSAFWLPAAGLFKTNTTVEVWGRKTGHICSAELEDEGVVGASTITFQIFVDDSSLLLPGQYIRLRQSSQPSTGIETDPDLFVDRFAYGANLEGSLTYPGPISVPGDIYV
jgi:hypothetical protein